MKNLLFLFLFIASFNSSLNSMVNDTNKIVVNLKDEVVENHGRYMYTILYDSISLEVGDDFVRFEVNETITTGVNGLEYYKEKGNYSKHSPINIHIFNQDSIHISFDDDGDGVFEDRPMIKTSIDFRNSSILLFKHKSNKEKDLRINCEFQITTTSMGHYMLQVFYNTKSEGTANIKGKDYNFSLWKSLNEFHLRINGEKVIRNNPIKIDDLYYTYKEYDPIKNVLVLSALDPSEKLYGTIEGFYVNEKQFKDALSFHKVDLSILKVKKYHLFYFWGHWCQPCMSKIEQTGKILNSVNNDIGVYNVSFMVKERQDDIQKVKDIVRDYDLPGVSTIEWYTSKTEDTFPVVQLFGNISYPNFVVLDSEYKILYVSDSSNIELEDFLESLK